MGLRKLRTVRTCNDAMTEETLDTRTEQQKQRDMEYVLARSQVAFDCIFLGPKDTRTEQQKRIDGECLQIRSEVALKCMVVAMGGFLAGYVLLWGGLLLVHIALSSIGTP